MASDYTPTSVTQGFGAEIQINQNFNDIKTAMDKMLSRLQNNDNAMGQQLDMGSKSIINLPSPKLPTEAVRLQDINSLAIKEVVQTLTFSSEISVDIASVTLAKLTLIGNTTLTFTGTPSDGQVVIFAIRQDAVGSRIITWESRVRFSVEIPTLTLSTTPDLLDYVIFRYNADDDKFDLLATNRGF